MTGGQVMLTLSEEGEGLNRNTSLTSHRAGSRGSFVVVSADTEELMAHEQVLALLDKASTGKTVWRGL
jgi:DNA polymerase III subunit epsilon